MHHSTGKLYNLVKRARPEQVCPKIKTINYNIYASCELWSTYSVQPFLFRTILPPEKVIFNRELAMDLMHLNKRPLLHIFDTATNFQNEKFTKSKSMEDCWQNFIGCWTTFRTCFPYIIRLDRETTFVSEKFLNNAKDTSIDLQFSGIESHNAIWQWDLYCHALRLIFNIVKTEHHRVDEKTYFVFESKPSTIQ